MSYRVLLHPKAAEFLRDADPKLREQIKARLGEPKESPRKRGRRLRHTQFWRLRIDDYRAIYEIHEVERSVALFIGHRRDVYDDFSRLL